MRHQISPYLANLLITGWIVSVLSGFLLLVSYLIFSYLGIIPDFNGFYQCVAGFVSKHWLTISLILSELAALLPGPWNGIAQAFIRVLNKKARRNRINH